MKTKKILYAVKQMPFCECDAGCPCLVSVITNLFVKKEDAEKQLESIHEAWIDEIEVE